VVCPESGRLRLVAGGVIRSRAADSLEQRVLEIHRGLVEVIQEHRPTTMAVEELYSTYAHPRTAILMGHARGGILLAAAMADLAVTSYSATQIKKTLTGSGRADKEQMQAAIRNEFGLAEAPKPNDVADALAVALCHHYLSKTMNSIGA
jgi:crossover junction endodeoxyribonuclease RuvC